MKSKLDIMREAMYASRAALRELDGSRGQELFGAVSDVLDTNLDLVRAVRAYLHTLKEGDGVT